MTAIPSQRERLVDRQQRETLTFECAGLAYTGWVMPAVNIAKALDGRRVGRGWIARCPAHDDRHPSLLMKYGRRTLVLAGDLRAWIGRLPEIEVNPTDRSNKRIPRSEAHE
jgi:hypothetical protein